MSEAWIDVVRTKIRDEQWIWRITPPQDVSLVEKNIDLHREVESLLSLATDLCVHPANKILAIQYPQYTFENDFNDSLDLFHGKQREQLLRAN